MALPPAAYSVLARLAHDHVGGVDVVPAPPALARPLGASGAQRPAVVPARVAHALAAPVRSAPLVIGRPTAVEPAPAAPARALGAEPVVAVGALVGRGVGAAPLTRERAGHCRGQLLDEVDRDRQRQDQRGRPLPRRHGRPCRRHVNIFIKD